MHLSRSREKHRRASVARPDSPSAGSTLAEANAHSKSRIKLLRTEYDSNCECGSPEETNSITLEFKRNYSKKANGMPIKALIDEEMSRKKHIKRSSPSLIARLMGLDALPSPGTVKPLKEVRSSSKNALSNDFQEKITTHDCSLQSSYDEQQEFKDVYEVVQVPKVEKQKDRTVKKGTASLRQREIDKVFIGHHFIDATSLSTGGIPQRSKELVDSEEDLDLNRDIYLPFLKEPSKHQHNLTSSPSPPHAFHPLILMASKDSPTASCQSSFGSEKNVDRSINLQKDDSQSFRKLAANSNSHPSREHMCSLLKKLSESTHSDKDEYCAQPTQIVILKPSLDKARKAERIIPSANSLNNLQYNLAHNLKFPVHDITEFSDEERARRKLHHTTEIMGRKIKGSREISKEVTKQMSTSASKRKKVSVPNLNDYEKDGGSCTTSSIMTGNNSQSSLLTSNLYASSNNSNYSSSFLTESSVTKEARKRLSERWKLTNHFQEMGFSNRASSTLAEMLALSDNETSKMTLDTLAVKKAPERKLVRQDFPELKNHPLGISSKDGWKDNFSRRLPRSNSLPASSLICENSQWNSRNRSGKSVNRIMHKKVEGTSNWVSLDDEFIRHKNKSRRNGKYVSNKDKHHSDGEENTLIEREIHVSSEKLKNNNDLRHASEKHTAFELPDDSTGETRDMADNLSVSRSNTDNSSLTDREDGFEKLQDLTNVEKNVKLSECDKHGLALKEPLINHVGDELPASHCNKSGSICPGSDKEADQPSPVSVLEAPFEEEEFSTGCFEKISADLQDLRMQLQQLKQESANNYTEDLEVMISSDEDAAAEPFPEYAGIIQSFRDEEERDYSYVLDILIDGDILKAELDGLFSACHSPECPVSPNLFDKLEKKYISLDSWSRSDRKLLFDLTNSILADIIEPKARWQLKMVHDGLVEEVWQGVVKKMKEVEISSVENQTELRWADIGDDQELLGRQLENMLQEDLLDELLIELTTYIEGVKSSL
ncbi:uncharacterized protein LOC110105943 [Dendrobium catenatum]|uniref:DUF4378 domain-containing protein n=1 Tax=Dendrobium catenatum TaxID=906689 RepID=A0A2I0WJC8_9ASPA|nr:uncharacterized protein LOC110105943 [Dendrobium catenatum]PKU75770.1 hypothetical protein MA16_Dca019726 [Dendrobium catenatum]